MNGENPDEDPLVARHGDPKGVHKETWSRTLEDMEAIAEDRRREGWDVVSVVAAHTDAVSKDMKDHGRFGLMHIIPNNHADRFTDIYSEERFTEYLAYARTVEGFVYLVTELIDPEAERSILIAGRYDTILGRGMLEDVEEEGLLYTYVKTVDGTVLGKIAHEEYDPFMPERTDV